MIKKILTIVLSLAMAITIAPTFSAPVKAGDSMEFIDIIQGVNSKDMTVRSTDVVTIHLDDLDSKIPGFKTRYLNGESSVKWSMAKADGTKSVDVKPELNGYKLQYRVEHKYKGMNMTLFVDDPGHTNYQGETFKVLGFTVQILSEPQFGDIYGSVTFLKKNFTIYINGFTDYTLNNGDTTYTSYDKVVKLYRNGKYYGKKKTNENKVVFNSVPVSYGKKDTFKAVLCPVIEGVEFERQKTTFKATSQKIPKIKVYATKISKKKAYLRWETVTGASGYYIYMGKKRVKTVGTKNNKKMITKKNAGKGKFRVIPFKKVGKKVYKSGSNTAKAKKNQYKWSRNLNPTAYNYATCPFLVTKISLSGKTYKVTGYALNHRVFTAKKYKSLTLGLKIDGKKAFKKKFKKVKLNIKENKKKKFTFKIKGKAGKDVCWGVKYLSVSVDPEW